MCLWAYWILGVEKSFAFAGVCRARQEREGKGRSQVAWLCAWTASVWLPGLLGYSGLALCTFELGAGNSFLILTSAL